MNKNILKQIKGYYSDWPCGYFFNNLGEDGHACKEVFTYNYYLAGENDFFYMYTYKRNPESIKKAIHKLEDVFKIPRSEINIDTIEMQGRSMNILHVIPSDVWKKNRVFTSILFEFIKTKARGSKSKLKRLIEIVARHGVNSYFIDNKSRLATHHDYYYNGGRVTEGMDKYLCLNFDNDIDDNGFTTSQSAAKIVNAKFTKIIKVNKKEVAA